MLAPFCIKSVFFVRWGFTHAYSKTLLNEGLTLLILSISRLSFFEAPERTASGLQNGPMTSFYKVVGVHTIATLIFQHAVPSGAINIIGIQCFEHSISELELIIVCRQWGC